MNEVELYWLKVSALSQVAAAVATFLAVVVSLYTLFMDVGRDSGWSSESE